MLENFASTHKMLLLSALAIILSLNAVRGQQDQPNIVFILADDLGIRTYMYTLYTLQYYIQ